MNMDTNESRPDDVRSTDQLSLIGLLVLVVALIPISIWAVMEEHEQWQAFAAEHNCKVIGRMSGSTSTGVGYGMAANGQFGTVVTITSTPSKTGYLCDDGVTYWR